MKEKIKLFDGLPSFADRGSEAPRQLNLWKENGNECGPNVPLGSNRNDNVAVKNRHVIFPRKVKWCLRPYAFCFSDPEQ